ncbi:methyltransferase family protein [Enemella evansiae]|uniref:methyltransferase family protein n=1 Tax=Enemella evansiae TaxID=2016499 RepID=UPI0015572DAF|nr:isoprenylcysteine carboxylmethyltransferase family protein [Enemella evansiae]
MQQDQPRVPPPVFAAAAAALQTLLARGSQGTRGSRIVAGLLTGASAGLMGASVLSFRRADTTLNPHEPDQATTLVQTGVFALTRNPIYLGMGGLLLAHAVGRRSWAAGVPLAGFLLVIDRIQIPAEERALGQKFGSEFEGYARRVPRWLPSLGKAN